MQSVNPSVQYVMLDHFMDITYVNPILHKQDKNITEMNKPSNKRDQRAISEINKQSESQRFKVTCLIIQDNMKKEDESKSKERNPIKRESVEINLGTEDKITSDRSDEILEMNWRR